jgi:hypothetical protein
MLRGILPVLLSVLAACAADPLPPAAPVPSFGDFRPPSDRPHALACPQNYCIARPDVLTPLLPVPADRMRFILKAALDAQPQMTLLSSENEGLRLTYRQGPGVFDTGALITAEIVDADDGVSGVVLYSEATATGSDAGDQRKRVRAFLAAIQQAAARQAARSNSK